MAKHKKGRDGRIPAGTPLLPTDEITARAVRAQEAQFRGWQTGVESLFPLYNIVKADHPSYGSTVSEATLQSMHIRVPRTPSPYPDVAPSPWHRLGVPLASPETMREALEGSGLDFTVVKLPLKDIVKQGNHANLADRWVTVRTDTGDVLGIVGKEYEPIQNRDAFGFFDRLVGANQAIYETAGAIGRGERIWILAKLPGYIRVRGKDIVSKYLLLSNSHDGSSLVQMKLTPIRVVCNNTLTAALKSAGEINIGHTINAADDAEEALSLLGFSNSLFDQIGVTFNRMALRKITDAQLLDYVKALVPDNEETQENTNVVHIREAILDLHENGQGAELSRGTLWGAFNCVAEFTDHAVEKLTSNWTGLPLTVGGEQLSRKAFHLVEQLL